MAKPDKKQQEPEKPSHPLMVNGKEWNHELVIDHICNLLATTSYGIGTILKMGYEGKDLPSYSSIMAWLDADKSLLEKYARAKEAQADFMADEILDIADDGKNDWMERQDKDGDNIGWQINGEHVQRSRLRIDSRKWLAAKLKPKKYGERTTLAGDPDAPLNPPAKADLSKLSTAEIETLIALQKKLSGEQ